ncbi:hypothetical protein MPSEU_000151900 [Mayamaea pseudoterrestris]|nr:hypothetical protein MPSEU_000151900 [Mayamaea pseudoterrestris]
MKEKVEDKVSTDVGQATMAIPAVADASHFLFALYTALFLLFYTLGVMFGGLEIKSAASTAKGKNKDTEAALSSDASSSSATAPSSAFGFLNSSNGTSTAPAPSAFSFMSEADESSPVTDVMIAIASESVETGGATAEGGASAASAFSFLSSTTEPAAAEAKRTRNAAKEFSSDEAASSAGFGFLTSSATNIPSPTETSNANNDSIPPPPPPAEDLLSSPTISSSSFSGAPVLGSSIVFGQQAVGGNSKTIIKRRNRTNKIGQGTPAVSSTGLPEPAAVTLPAPSSLADNNQHIFKSTSKSNILTAAEQATQRAEQFLQAAQTTTGSNDHDIEDDDRSRSIRSVPSDDSVLQKAKAAAMEAQEKIMADSASSSNASTGNKYFASRIGGLFRPRQSESGSSANSSSHGIGTSNGSHNLRSSSSASSMESGVHHKHQQSAVPRSILPPTQQQRKPPMDETSKRSDNIIGAGSMNFVPPPVPDLDRAISAPINLQPLSAPHTPDPYGNAMATALAPIPARRRLKTPTDRFHDMLQEFRDKVISYMDQITRLRQHRSGLLEERFVTLAKERLVVQQIQAAQAQQQLAAEQEDFDLAELLQTVIRNHERERIELATVRDSIAQALEQVDDQRQHIIDAVTMEFSRIQLKLEEFEKEQNSLECTHAAEHVAKFTIVAKQLSTEQERLNHDLKHLERDAKLVTEERKELEAAISEQTSEIELMRDDAKVKLKTVQEEIEELRRQLAAKQQTAAQLRTEAAGHEEAILKVRVKFARQLTRVQRKEMSVKDAREEWEQEKQTYDRNKEEHDRKMTEHSEQLLAQEQLRASLSKEMELAETFGEIIAKEVGLGFVSSDDEVENGDLAQMHTEVVKCEAAVSEAKTVLKTTSATLSNMEDEIKTLETRIPLLEETKKECAAKRDFKGAGVASKEIKEAISRVNECRDAIDDVRARQVSSEEIVVQLEEELAGKRLIAQEYELETNLAVMDRLADKIKRLMSTKENVCSSTDDLSVKGVGAYVLQSQIKALYAEGHALGEKCGGWSERMASIGFSNDMKESNAKLGAESVAECRHSSPTAADGAPRMVHEEKEASEPVNQDSIKEKQARYRGLASRLGAVESDIEAAAEAEDFEKAAEMQEELDKLLVELQGLDLTDEEMEAALVDGDGPIDPLPAKNDDAMESTVNPDFPEEPTQAEVDSIATYSDEEGLSCTEKEVADERQQEDRSLDDTGGEETTKTTPTEVHASSVAAVNEAEDSPAVMANESDTRDPAKDTYAAIEADSSDDSKGETASPPAEDDEPTVEGDVHEEDVDKDI